MRYCSIHGVEYLSDCPGCETQQLVKMLELRKELDPDAPDVLVFPETQEKSAKPRFISHNCDSDHCTDEERDVIEAALAWYEDVDQLQKLRDTEVTLINKVALVTSPPRHHPIKG